MKTKLISPLFLVCAVSAVHSAKSMQRTNAQSFARTDNMVNVYQAKLTPVAEKLFRGVTSRLSVADKNKAAAASSFVISKSDKNLFTFTGEEEAPFNVEVTVVDLNSDGVEEIILQWGNSFWSGYAGTSCTLLVKNVKTGNYDSNLGFPGIVEVLSTKTNGYKDLKIDLPGFEFPVYKWTGTKYELKGRVKQ